MTETIAPLSEIPDAQTTASTIERLREAGVLGDCYADFSRVLDLRDPEADFDRYESIGRFLAASHNAARWWLADWLVYGESTFGDKYYQAAEVTGLSEPTLVEYYRVGLYVARSRRRPDLHFSHHREVAKLLPDEQARWLQRASEQVWSSRELREQISAISAAPQDSTKSTLADPAVETTPGSAMDVHYSSETVEWETPRDLFDVLDAEFRFDLDVCATPANTKCRSFFTVDHDGLAQSWLGADVWMNPPYGSEIGAWVKKASETAEQGGRVVCCLLPARVDTGWWWDYCRHAEIRFLRGRLRFGGGENGAPFPSAVVIFGRPAKVVWWDGWRKA